MMELIDLVKFNVHPKEQKANAHALCVAGSEDKVHIAKGAAVALLASGWDASFIGDVGEQIDPFFDIDFQRYLVRLWSNKHGLMLVCIFSSGEGSLRFLTSTAKEIKGKVRGDLRIAAVSTQQLQPVAEESSDYVATDLVALIEWAEQEFNQRISV